MHRVISLAVNVARSDAPVLITGPSGSGKERLAEIVQANSRRRRGPLSASMWGPSPKSWRRVSSLVPRRCVHRAAGQTHRTFRDRRWRYLVSRRDRLAVARHPGQTAAGAAERRVPTLGSSHTHRVDVRVISASNAVIEEAVSQGRLREDLLFRLNVVELSIPPWRPPRGHPASGRAFSPATLPARRRAGDLSLTDPARQALLSTLGRERAGVGESHPKGDCRAPGGGHLG